jgi:uncharacterized protein (DUF934 family)
MPDIIRNRRVEPDRWTYVGLAAADELARPLPAGPVAVPLAAWQERRAELLARHDPVGVWLEPGDDPFALRDDVGFLAFIAVHFPKFGEGRGYSTATLLRQRLEYRGELRAFGDIGRDHLFHLARVGFDSFALAAHRDPHDALKAFDDFSERYQGSVDNPEPLFRRRDLSVQ